MHWSVSAVAAAALLAAGACKSSTPPSSTSPTPTTGAPTVLTFSAVGSLNISVGDSRQLKAVALLSDGTTQVLTNAATWISSNDAVASVDSSGIVAGVSAGATSITVKSGTVSGTITVTVTATAADSQEFVGIMTGPNGLSGTVDIFVFPSTRATGTLYVGTAAVSLIGRLDIPASVVNVVGGAYTFLGTLSNGVLAGSVTDALGNGTGSFAALDATHTAVTTYCGTYSANDGSGGAMNLALSVTGAAAASATRSDGAGALSVFVGRGDGGTLLMTTSDGRRANGSAITGTAIGTLQPPGASTGSFTAGSNACR